MAFKVTMRVPPASTSQVMRSVNRRTERVVVIATETPVDRWDEKRGLYREVLLMSGVRFRGGRNQIPIVDSHDDSTVRNILGSVRNLTVDNSTGELYGEDHYSQTLDAKDTATKIAEGHITDFSITAMPLDGVWIDRGQTYTTDRGETIEGPAHIITLWEPHNASVCATGADVNSIVRRSYTDLKRKERSMEGSMPDLSSLGVPEGMTDANQIIAFLAGKLAMPAEREMPEEPVAPEMVESMEEEVPVVPTEEVQKMDEAVKEEVARALAAERKRRAEIVSDCTLAKLERSFADKLCDSGVSADEARKAILKEQSTRTVTRSLTENEFSFVDGTDPRYAEGSNITVTESAHDKFASAVSTGIVMRSFANSRIKRQAVEKVTPEVANLSKLSISRLAEYWVESQGFPVRRMDKNVIARAAMGSPSVFNQFRISRDVYHTRGTFANILVDAANKTLRAAYDEAPYTWSIWARQAASTENLHAINRTQLGEVPDLDMIPEGKEYTQLAVSDSKVTYSIEKFGGVFSVSWESIMKDDLDAISRVPAMLGVAARRKQNKLVYGVLFANPTMADGQTLFSSSHASGDNTSGAAAAPGVTTLNTGYTRMALQKGLTTDVNLNIIPRYLIVPQAYAATALELVNSSSYALSNGNDGVINIYGVNGVRPIEVVADAVLDGNSSTRWYLAADPSQIDTVELTFLSGEESPVVESEVDFDTDTQKNKVRQTFGVAAIDWRGLYRNA
jgi:hypothetical protein